jgi:UDP-glucose 4-epimerase
MTNLLKGSAWLVTGAAGYIGSHVTNQLQKHGATIVGLDNFSTSKEISQLTSGGTLLKGDIRNPKDLENAFVKLKSISDRLGVVHIAGLKKPMESWEKPSEYYSVNTLGTNLLANFAKLYNVKNFIFSSSCSVYGENSDSVLSERTLTIPLSPYGRSKLFAEMILDDIFNNTNTSLIKLRYFNVAGVKKGLVKDTSETNLFPNLLKAVNSLGGIKIFGSNLNTIDGTCVRDYIHVEDLSRAHALAANYVLKQNKMNEIINVGTGRGYSVLEIVERFEKIWGTKLPKEFGDHRKGDPIKSISSNIKAKDLLGWSPDFDLTSIIQSLK